MDFSLSPQLQALREQTRAFIAEQVIPLENDGRQSSHGPSEALRRELVGRARTAGLLTPHASKHFGGLGLTHVEKAVVQFYKALALERFQVALADLAAELGETKAMQLLITNAWGRWGSCTDRGRIIRLSAKLLMAPPLVQDYVIVHELCHLEHMDHSPRF